MRPGCGRVRHSQRLLLTMLWLLVPAALFLAFSNGANDNFKGFATVWGTETLSYRFALSLATLATLAGSVASVLLSGELLQSFSGAGLVPDEIAAGPHFASAVAVGAAITVMTATRLGFPISTTHALIGGMIGAGLSMNTSDLDFNILAGKFLLPLLLSPLFAAALGFLGYGLLRRRQPNADCVCLIERSFVEAPAVGRFRMMSGPALVVASTEHCDALAAPTSRWSIPLLMDRAHVFSATSICFARSLNDTPKLAALLLVAQLSGAGSMLLVVIAMAAGGLLFARRVAETMSRRLNLMDPPQGLSANLITAALVLCASGFGLPVSTTHVSVGSIAGVGLTTGTTDLAVLRNVLLSWVATLPMAAVIASAAAQVLAAP